MPKEEPSVLRSLLGTKLCSTRESIEECIASPTSNRLFAAEIALGLLVGLCDTKESEGAPNKSIASFFGSKSENIESSDDQATLLDRWNLSTEGRLSVGQALDLRLISVGQIKLIAEGSGPSFKVFCLTLGLLRPLGELRPHSFLPKSLLDGRYTFEGWVPPRCRDLYWLPDTRLPQPSDRGLDGGLGWGLVREGEVHGELHLCESSTIL